MTIRFAQLAPAEIWRGLRTERPRRRILLAWSSFAVFELVLSACNVRPTVLVAGALELCGLTFVGLLHGALAPADWRGSAAWAGTLGTAVVVWRMAAEAVRLAFSFLTAAVPFLGLGLVALAYVVVRLLDRLVWRRVPAVALSFVGPFVLYLAAVGPRQVLQPLWPTRAPAADGPPLVVVTVDTLRSDAAAEMETLRWLRARGALWPRATAASSWTWPSIVTLWSGVDAETHRSGRPGAVRHRIERWSESLPWLPRELREAGYVTAAFVTNPMLHEMPLAPSFDRFTFGGVVAIPLALAGFAGGSADGGDAHDIVDAAIAWLDRAPARGFALWVHLYGPHLPYRHAAGERSFNFNLLRRVRMGHWFMVAEEQEAVRNAYRAEVDYTDRQIVRLLEALERRGLFDGGTFVFTADHGEELWEHGGYEHGHSHHGEVIDVPLVLVSPGVVPGERGGVAALEDVTPTLRAVIGHPPRGLDLRQPIPPDRVARAFGNLYFRPMKSLRVGTTRIIVDGDLTLAYDLVADPGENAPRVLTPEALRALIASGPVAPPGPAEPQSQALRALGYVD